MTYRLRQDVIDAFKQCDELRQQLTAAMAEMGKIKEDAERLRKAWEACARLLDNGGGGFALDPLTNKLVADQDGEWMLKSDAAKLIRLRNAPSGQGEA